MTRVPSTPYRYAPRADHGQRASRIDRVIVHVMEGTRAGAESWFNSRENTERTGAHLLVGKKAGDVVQIAGLERLLYHTINANQNGVGIEHEGKASDSKLVWAARRTQRKMSANRCAWICYVEQLGQPTFGTNLFGHHDIPGNDHTCPGPNFPRSLYQRAARRAYRNLVASHGQRWTR